MNERIKKLAEQAREFATTRHPVSNIVLSVNSEKFEEKFAELIIMDVANKLEPVLASEILELYGVEE